MIGGGAETELVVVAIVESVVVGVTAGGDAVSEQEATTRHAALASPRIARINQTPVKFV